MSWGGGGGRLTVGSRNNAPFEHVRFVFSFQTFRRDNTVGNSFFQTSSHARAYVNKKKITI